MSPEERARETRERCCTESCAGNRTVCVQCIAEAIRAAEAEAEARGYAWGLADAAKVARRHEAGCADICHASCEIEAALASPAKEGP
jgi:hypothetical protein